VVAATWVIACASLITTLTNTFKFFRHARKDDQRFAEVAEKLNGTSPQDAG
jgi:hypothetical protein